MSGVEARKPAILLGGARFGWLRVTWPLAVLRASEDFIEVILVLGRRRFVPEEVVAIEPVTWFPLLAWGVSIVHLRSDAPERITFWSIRPPAAVMRAIERAGFVAKGVAAKTTAGPQDEQPLLRPQFLGAAVLTAALILAVDRLLIPNVMPGQPSYAAVALLALVCGSSLLMRRSGRFQQFAMSAPEAPGHRELLNFITIVSGLMLFGAAAELLDHLKTELR